MEEAARSPVPLLRGAFKCGLITSGLSKGEHDQGLRWSQLGNKKPEPLQNRLLKHLQKILEDFFPYFN